MLPILLGAMLTNRSIVGIRASREKAQTFEFHQRCFPAAPMTRSDFSPSKRRGPDIDLFSSTATFTPSAGNQFPCLISAS
jgi:hypothetical protein